MNICELRGKGLKSGCFLGKKVILCVKSRPFGSSLVHIAVVKLAIVIGCSDWCTQERRPNGHNLIVSTGKFHFCAFHCKGTLMERL